MFKKLFTAILAMMMCITALAACGDSEDSESSIHASKKQRERMNSSAKTIFTIANNFCQKGLTVGKDVFTTATTDILVVKSGGEEADVNNLVKATKDGEIPSENIAELQKAINAGLNDTANDYIYIIEFEKGFPKTVYISKKSDESFVGRYPTAMEDDEDGAYSLKSFAN